MSTVLYSVTSRKMMFNGNRDLEELSRDTNYWYEGTDREWMGNFMHNNNECDLYRYTGTAFGDFTAYREEGNIWLPETFSDYAIMTPDELTLAMNDGVTFWQDWQTTDPEARLLYKIFQNN